MRPVSNAAREGDLSNVELATIHEFGTSTVPERSFIRSAYAANRKTYLGMLRDVVKRMLETGRVEVLEKGLNIIAVNTVDEVIEHALTRKPKAIEWIEEEVPVTKPGEDQIGGVVTH